ncbi:MAG: hypothetical protein ACSHX0_05240 [Akkermansiaceae bacterium]
MTNYPHLMNPEIYRYIHYTGIFILLLAFGSLLSSNKNNKSAAIGHGIGLLLILLGGFGMQAKFNYGFPTWMILKLVIWLVLGGFMVLLKRGIVKGLAAWIIIIALGLSAVYLGKNKLMFLNTPAAIEVAE